MNDYLKRTWAEINLDALRHNYGVIRAAVRPQTKICCAVKADAYGHGAEFVSLELEKIGADWFAVSNLEEAMQLRRCGVSRPILILGYTPPQMAEKLHELDISQTILSHEYGRELSACAEKAGVSVRAHIKLDTGMSRIGFLYQEPSRDVGALRQIEEVCRMPGILAEGIFTHFAVSDEGKDGEAFTRQQYACFREAVARLEQSGIRFSIHHCANSGAVMDYPELDFDMVRPGIILYGLMPSDKIRRTLDLVPAMELKTVISLLKTVEPGTSVSYGCEFVTSRRTVLATVPIGYADGYPRRLHDRADMLVCGKRARVVGRVCMDQLMLDVTDIPEAKPGMTVTVWGRDGGGEIGVDEIAALDDTINYEMICLVGKRVPRIFLRGGKPVGQLNYICPEE
jgi:alanine racemase